MKAPQSRGNFFPVNHSQAKEYPLYYLLKHIDTG